MTLKKCICAFGLSEDDNLWKERILKEDVSNVSIIKPKKYGERSYVQFTQDGETKKLFLDTILVYRLVYSDSDMAHDFREDNMVDCWYDGDGNRCYTSLPKY